LSMLLVNERTYQRRAESAVVQERGYQTMTYAQLQESLRVLGLGERCTLREMKTRHRELAKRHHPDSGNAGDPEMIRRVNAAYRIVYDYLSEYRFSFAEEEFYEQNPEERIRRQFADDPLWGKG